MLQLHTQHDSGHLALQWYYPFILSLNTSSLANSLSVGSVLLSSQLLQPEKYT